MLGATLKIAKKAGLHQCLRALATLAWRGGSRAAYGRQQLNAVLRILEHHDVDARHMVGSWAGAMGQVQFMPSSFLNFAVDQDGDGRKDLWHSLPDVFGSAAHYLQQHGWKEDETWARRVKAPASIDAKQLGVAVSKPLAEWQALGVRNLDGSALHAVGQTVIAFPVSVFLFQVGQQIEHILFVTVGKIPIVHGIGSP